MSCVFNITVCGDFEMSLKKFLKQGYTFLVHPIVSVHLLKEGCKNFYIGPRMNIKGLKNFHLGSNSTIGKDSRFLCVSGYKGGYYIPSVNIGKNVYIAYHFTAMSAAPIEIGDNTLIASGVVITSENHGTDPELADSYADTPLEAKPVTIGKGCWLGENVIITPGVELGDRCIVAAGAVVTNSFPSFSMIGGVPAKIIKMYNHDSHEWEKASR